MNGLEKVDRNRRFEQSSADSWWLCLQPSCRQAFQKQDCHKPGVCPNCNGSAYNSLPWQHVISIHPELPEIPQRGREYDF